MSLKPMCPAGTSLDSLVLALASETAVLVTSLLSNATPTLKGLFRAVKQNKKYYQQLLVSMAKFLWDISYLTRNICLFHYQILLWSY